MKKTILMAALVLMSAGCFAQKANVKKAKNLAMQETPDFVGARAAIQEALVNDETKNLAETWYVAGLIGYQEAQAENLKRMLGQEADWMVAGKAAEDNLECWLKADSIAMIPTLDKKGREVVDTKTRQNISRKLLEMYQAAYLINYGSILNDNRDFKAAYKAFNMYVSIPDLPMMQDPKLQKSMPKDSTYEQFCYYVSYFATQSDMHQEAIAMLEKMKNGSFEPSAIQMRLAEEYETINDTVAFLGALQDGMQRFPQESWFLQKMINHYIYSGKEDEAIKYLKQAIDADPTSAQYHFILGNLYEKRKSYEEAMIEYDRAIAIDPEADQAWAGKGFVYFDKANDMQEAINNAPTNKEFNELLKVRDGIIKQAAENFEEAHRINPTEHTYMANLKSFYFQLKKSDPSYEAKYDAITEELNK